MALNLIGEGLNDALNPRLAEGAEHALSIRLIKNLKLALPPGGDRAYAVDDVSFDLTAGKSSAWSANPVPASRCAPTR